MAKNYYQILQISQNASKEEIKLAYRRLAKKYHPDRNPGNPEFEEEFKLINEAYHTLSDENKKWVYDMGMYMQQNPVASSYSAPRSSTIYERKYRSRPYYSYSSPPPKTFTTKAYFQAALFIAILVVIVVICISLLNKYSSYYYYQEAVKDYHRGQYQSALSNLDFSIIDFGNTSPHANVLAAKILIYEYKEFNEALNYLERGLNAAGEEANLAEIHYLKGLSLKNLGHFGEAYENYQTSISYDNKFDSSYYELGEINVFIFHDYKKALANFNQLLSINSLFTDAYLGKGICYQRLNQHGLAVMNFEKFISLNSSEGTVYYLKSLSEIELNNKNLACKDLEIASGLGIAEAEKLLKHHCQ